MRRLILAAGLALAACAPAPRQTGAQMTSVVAFDTARFAGTWHEIAAVGRPAGAVWRVAATGEALAVETTRDGAGQGRLTGPGRFTLSSFAVPLWVLWADADMRTVVLGTPGRELAMVLDRRPGGAPDRLAAAREILGWNGYSPGALR